MPNFVNNLNNLVVDDQYFMEVPSPPGTASVPTGNVGILGTFSRGPVNIPVLCPTYPDLVKKFGESDTALLLTGTICARQLFAQGNTNVYVVRVQPTGTPVVAASVPVKDTSVTPLTVFTLTAKSPGSWGNALQASVSAGSKAGTFKLSLQYGAESETWDNLIVAQPTTPIVGAVLLSVLSQQSNLVNVAIPTTPVLTAWAVASYVLVGGTDGAAAVAADYIGTNTAGVKTGLFALDSAPINYVLAAEMSDPTINLALSNNAQTISAQGGMPRKAIVTFPKTTQPAGLAALLIPLDTDRVFPCYLYQQVYDSVTAGVITVSPLGFFAGLLTSLTPQQSTGNKAIFGSLGFDPTIANVGPADFIVAAQAHVNMVGVTTPAGPIGVRGGFTASSTAGEFQQIYVRNMKDYIDSLVFTQGGLYVDEPITEDLMRQVKQTVDNILYIMKMPNAPQDKMISDYRITCDGSNNSGSSLAQNMLICDYAVKLLNMNRFMIFRTQISPGVIITK